MIPFLQYLFSILYNLYSKDIAKHIFEHTQQFIPTQS
jgi:hypothetical protein